MDEETDPGWRWCNCRRFNVAVHWLFAPWDWRLVCGIVTDSCLEWCADLQIGPFMLTFYADIGNSTTGDWRAKFSLSEQQAWERANERS